jgi:hypothetical protein
VGAKSSARLRQNEVICQNYISVTNLMESFDFFVLKMLEREKTFEA